MVRRVAHEALEIVTNGTQSGVRKEIRPRFISFMKPGRGFREGGHRRGRRPRPETICAQVTPYLDTLDHGVADLRIGVVKRELRLARERARR